MQVAVFHETDDTVVTKNILPGLKARGLDPIHVYKRSQSRNPLLNGAEVILYVTNHPNAVGRLKVQKISEDRNLPLVHLPFSKARWDAILEQAGLKKEPPANDDARIALVPPPPPSSTDAVVLDTAPTDVPPPPSTNNLTVDDREGYIELLEKENADLRVQWESAVMRTGEAITRALKAEARVKAMPVLAMPEPPKNWKEILESMRVLVMYGQIDGIQALDLLANGPLA